MSQPVGGITRVSCQAMSIQDSVLPLLLLLPLAVDIEDLIRIVARNVVALLSTGLGIPKRIEIRSRSQRIKTRR